MEDSQYRHAIETARADANYLIACDFLDRPPAWFRAWFDFDLKWSDGDIRYVTIPKIEVENLIARARRDPIVFELLKFIVGTRLRSGVPLPLEMRKLISDFLTNDFKAPKGAAGRRGHWGRDFIIINTMRRRH